MRVDLSGKTALVTGSTQGIGSAIAAGLAAAGARVAINGRSETGVLKAIARLREDLPDADLVPAPGDVSDEAGAAQVVEEVPEADILINNLGIFGAQGPWRSPTPTGGATSRSTSWPRCGSPARTCPG